MYKDVEPFTAMQRLSNQVSVEMVWYGTITELQKPVISFQSVWTIQRSAKQSRTDEKQKKQKTEEDGREQRSK
jgi:hypothetical protein